MSKYKMRYTILGIQQAKMLEYNLDLTDALLIDTLRGMYASPSFERILENGNMYIWINQTFLLDYIPVLGSRATLQRRLNKLEDLGFVERIVKHVKNGKKGNFSYITLLPKIEELTEYNTINEPMSQKEDLDISETNSSNNNNDLSIDNLVNDSKAHEIANPDTLCQNETRAKTPCVKMKQPLCQNETTLVSKRHNKDTLNKDTLNKDTHSFILKENNNKKDNRMNERMNDDKNQEESIDRKTYFEKIINSLELYGFQKEEDRDALKCAVRYLCYAKGDLETNNMVIPRKEALDHLLEANWFNAEWTIRQFKQMGRIQPITNPIPYIAKILYNSLYDLKLREQSEWRLEGLPYID